MKNPIKELESGAIRVVVYYAPVHTRGKAYDAYEVRWSEHGRNYRKARANKQEAIELADQNFNRMVKYRNIVDSLSESDVASYARSKQIIDDIETPLELIVSEWVDAHKRSNGASLSRMVDSWLKHNPSGTKTVQEVVSEVLAVKKQDGVTKEYLRELTAKLTAFSETFQGSMLSAVKGDDIKKWINGMGCSQRTKNNYRSCLFTLYEFAKQRNYLAQDNREMQLVTKFKEDLDPVAILTPDEMQKVLDACSPKFLPFVAIAAFSGIRHAEIKGMRWKDVHLDIGQIEVLKPKRHRTASSRMVPIPANLKNILEACKNKVGMVCPYVNAFNELSRLFRRAGVKSHQDVFRHSAISYRLVIVKNIAEVALEAGNSPAVIFKHYRKPVKPQDAERWFTLVPAWLKI